MTVVLDVCPTMHSFNHTTECHFPFQDCLMQKMQLLNKSIGPWTEGKNELAADNKWHCSLVNHFEHIPRPCEKKWNTPPHIVEDSARD